MKSLLTFFFTFTCALLFAQESEEIQPPKYSYPVLEPYELGAKGNVRLPEDKPTGLLCLKSDKMELSDMPQIVPYTTTAYFDGGRLISLHVVFGETGEGMSLKQYESLTHLFLKWWKYPTNRITGRRGNPYTQVWETPDFRIEWVYKNQKDATGKKIGWLFIYTRDQYIEEY